jgi:hypothetical protein
MSEAPEYRFRTKTGTCTVTPERIILKREGVCGAVAETAYKTSIGRALTIYGVIGTVALLCGIWSLINRDFVAGGFQCAIGIFFIWNIVVSRNNSFAPVIDRSAIRKIVAHPPHPPVTRGYFAVLFEEDGRIRKRLIMIPGSMQGGKPEYERALTAMREAGLLRWG